MFHVDRARQIEVGHVFATKRVVVNRLPELTRLLDRQYPDGLSSHGKTYLCEGTPPHEWPMQYPTFHDEHGRVHHAVPADEAPRTAGRVKDAHIEAIFELVRRAQFPDRPSRFASLFAVDSVEAAERFLHRVGWAEPANVLSLDGPSGPRFDMNWLDSGSPLMLWHFAEQYWSGAERAEFHPMWEYLVPCPQTVTGVQTIQPTWVD